ncbi:MAG: glycosyltransferase family 1 protein [Burkholderiaceae bacterium]|jgi:glycosyltransferase involved in cell wall biosynthesis|nr:glycosyltransferase family 4 protein [Burkholderiaceae bacterium]MCZ8174845.1 glycosyltransferase family 1 protein [Burkholderiaceae bacterium]
MLTGDPRRAVGVCFGKMSTMNEGLGEYAMLFGEHLALRSAELRDRHGIHLWFRLPRRLHGAFGPEVHYLEAHPLDRYLRCPWLGPGRFDLWHSLHQHNPYRPPWRVGTVLSTVHDLNHLHGTDERFRQKAKRRLARVAAESDAFVAVSRHTRADLAAAIGTAKPIEVVLNGVRDLSRVLPERPAALPAGVLPGCYFFHLSRMAALKNPQAMLDMMAERPRDTLVMAGPRAGDSEAVAAQVLARGLTNVQVLFDVSQAEKTWLLANCRAFLFPSLAEGFGLPPIEAMQFGRPVLLSDRTCLPEIGGPVAGYWHDFAPQSMSHALDERLAQADADPTGDATRTREWATRYSWPRCIDEHLALYRRLLGA